MTEKERLEDKRKTNRALLLVAVGFVFFLFYQFKTKTNVFGSSEESAIENTTYQDNIMPETSEDYSGNQCAECGKKCKTSSEIYSSGDAMSNYKPYYLCGDMGCVNRRYEKDSRMKKYEQQEEQYRNDMREQGEEAPTLHVD